MKRAADGETLAGYRLRVDRDGWSLVTMGCVIVLSVMLMAAPFWPSFAGMSAWERRGHPLFWLVMALMFAWMWVVRRYDRRGFAFLRATLVLGPAVTVGFWLLMLATSARDWGWFAWFAAASALLGGVGWLAFQRSLIRELGPREPRRG